MSRFRRVFPCGCCIAVGKLWFSRKIVDMGATPGRGFPLLGSLLFSSTENWVAKTEVNRDVPCHLTGSQVGYCRCHSTCTWWGQWW